MFGNGPLNPPILSVKADISVQRPGAKSSREQMQQITRAMRAYSITSSARASSVGGTSRPSALAVLEVDHEFEFGRLLDRQVGQLRPAQNPVD